mgnify:CR=1 FL=1
MYDLVYDDNTLPPDDVDVVTSWTRKSAVVNHRDPLKHCTNGSTVRCTDARPYAHQHVVALDQIGKVVRTTADSTAKRSAKIAIGTTEALLIRWAPPAEKV